MEKSLKEQNRRPLAFALLGNAVVYIAVLGGDWTLADLTTELARLQGTVLAPILTALAGVVNAQIGATNKARLVFWRWSHPLPGSRAFTEHMHTDPRIDVPALGQYQDPLPTEPDMQNALWYRWYREVEEDPRIRQVHGEYLFSRDYAGISVLLACSLGPLSFWQLETAAFAAVYSTVLVAQYILVRRAAYNHGVRFVTSVLATKAGAVRGTGGG